MFLFFKADEMTIHGGNLDEARRKYVENARLVDLSTGITAFLSFAEDKTRVVVT